MGIRNHEEIAARVGSRSIAVSTISTAFFLRDAIGWAAVCFVFEATGLHLLLYAPQAPWSFRTLAWILVSAGPTMFVWGLYELRRQQGRWRIDHRSVRFVSVYGRRQRIRWTDVVRTNWKHGLSLHAHKSILFIPKWVLDHLPGERFALEAEGRRMLELCGVDWRAAVHAGGASGKSSMSISSTLRRPSARSGRRL